MSKKSKALKRRGEGVVVDVHSHNVVSSKYNQFKGRRWPTGKPAILITDFKEVAKGFAPGEVVVITGASQMGID